MVLVGTGPMADAKRRLIERAGASCCAETEAHHARLAFVALDDRVEAEAASRRLKARGLLVNVADRPDLCDFTLPSILDRDPVLIAVGTAGASAGLAKQLRLRLERILPASLGILAERLRDRRGTMRQRWPNGDIRRRAIDAALSPGGVLDPLRDQDSGAVDRWLAAADTVRPATLCEIVLTSDDPDDLTLRHARLLGEADVVFHEPDVAPAILVRARADAERRIWPGALPSEGATVILRCGSDAPG